MRIWALTVFAAAFLLFQIQPLFSKFVQPWFGGGPTVWTTCLLFFQVFLLAGYAYAHALTGWLRPRTQAILHLALLLAASLTLPISPAAQGKPEATADPTGQILGMLTACLGLPYFALATTGPLLQAWVARIYPGTAPYRLYALSNTGSLLALVSYPLVFEPLLTRQTQATLWGWGFGAFALLGGTCASRLWRESASGAEPATPGEAGSALDAPTGRPTRMLWFGLSACGAVLLLACTNKLCEDVASVPFMWVLPLALYLSSFALCFDHPAVYRRRVFMPLLVAMVSALCYALFQKSKLPLASLVAIYGGALWSSCMVCHGELYRLRPASRSLTLFYLLVATGGVAGGVFVVLVAPHVFQTYAELNWGIGLLAALVTLLLAREGKRWKLGRHRVRVWPMALSGAVVLSTLLLLLSHHATRDTVAQSRSFYGTLQIRDVHGDDPVYHALILQHGQVTHGLQFVEPGKAAMPTSFYGELSGVGLALRHFPRQTNRHIGVVGLGVGTLAAYGQAGDTIRFYEINPDVERLARTRFTYLTNCPANIVVVQGDARLALERAPSQDFDVLVLDAFNSDAIPTHLLTKEAFETYLRHLKPDGVIAAHVSNRHLNLYPVMRGMAGHFGLQAAYIHGPEREWAALWWFSPSMWVLLSRDAGWLDQASIREARHPSPADLSQSVLWTDDYVSLLPLIRGL